MASRQTYDFAVLGTNQPEGLLLAAGLSRKGYSVLVIPSQTLGELPNSEEVPLYFPEIIGKKRLEDLLFRVGFFRLEESGLVESGMSPQVILPRNRLTLGKQMTDEFEREFPGVAELLNRYWSTDSKTNLRKITSQLRILSKRYPDLAQWMDTSFFLATGKSHRAKFDLRMRSWIRSLPTKGSRFYRVKPDLSEPYPSFLLEHARKWGTKLLEEDLKFKSGFTSFQVNPDIRAKRLILNSSAASKLLVDANLKRVPSRVLYWLYFDEAVVDFDDIPEPLEDQSKMILGSGKFDQVRKISVIRDYTKRRAQLRLGTWLSQDSQSEWSAKIQEGRVLLKKILPFFPQEKFSSVPSPLDLSEEMGNCVKRGQVGRLIYDLESKPGLGWLSAFRSPYQVSTRVYSVTPQFLPLRDRTSSLESCFFLMDHFSKNAATNLDAVAKA